ncbi:MAG TPA: hypothetical protein DD643_01300 [Synechococcus sp. UBA8638]|nr:hypothetical protein [Synechococcus sp. UBA8638]
MAISCMQWRSRSMHKSTERRSWKLDRVEIENYRAIGKLHLPLDRDLTVLHGENGHGKTSVLSAIAMSLESIRMFLLGLSSVDFRKVDSHLRVGLTTVGGMAWDRQGMVDPRSVLQEQSLQDLKGEMDAIISADQEGTEPLDLPIVAFYDTDRAVLDPPQHRSKSRTEFPRYEALRDALSARADFEDTVHWFHAKENEELREQKERLDFGHQRNDLKAVRKAIEAMLPGVSNPRIGYGPLCFVVSVQPDDGEPEKLSIDQLSGGYRIMLALAADLARRMAQGNPHLEDPLQSEAVVLIDEVELHLHPSWQQRVLADLTRTFPNTQFIVSTHSPQVLTTVKPEHVVELWWEQGEIVAGSVGAPTYGAKAGDVLATVMGVKERPDGNEFVKKLAQYTALVAEGKGESPEAISLRQELDALSPRDSELDRADIEIRRRKLFQSMGRP